jgi:hypothetical protein
LTLGFGTLNGKANVGMTVSKIVWSLLEVRGPEGRKEQKGGYDIFENAIA